MQRRLSITQIGRGMYPSLVRPNLVIEYNASSELNAGCGS
jgi:hypothetical protein